MQTKIVEKEAFKVIGIKRTYQNQEEAMAKIPAFWEECANSHQLEILQEKMDDEFPNAFIGLSKPIFEYYICVSSKQTAPAGFEEFTVPKAKWLVVEAKGKVPDALQETMEKLFNEFLPNSEYQMADQPELEVYPEGDISSDSYVTEIWIPVIAK